MPARFGVRGEATDLDKLLLDVLRNAKAGNMSELHALLDTPTAGAKSGLHALRTGLAAMAKLAAEEHEATRRDAGWAPWDEVQDQLAGKNEGDPQVMQDPRLPRLRKLVWPCGAFAIVEVEGDPVREARVVQRSWDRPDATKGTEADTRAWGRLVLTRINSLANECPPGAREDLARYGKARDVDALKRLAGELQERLESLGCNSEEVARG